MSNTTPTDTTRTPEDAIRDALQLIRREYRERVSLIADDVIDEARREYADGVSSSDLADAVDTHLHESVDGDEWIIYTQKAQLVLLVSDNDVAWTEYGMEAMAGDGMEWSRMAFAAMEADVMDELRGRGFDPGDPADFFMEEEDLPETGGGYSWRVWGPPQGKHGVRSLIGEVVAHAESQAYSLAVLELGITDPGKYRFERLDHDV